MISSIQGGALCNTATALLANSAGDVSANIKHGIISGNAVERIDRSDRSSLVITDSICATETVEASNTIRIFSIAPMSARRSRVSPAENPSAFCLIDLWHQDCKCLPEGRFWNLMVIHAQR